MLIFLFFCEVFFHRKFLSNIMLRLHSLEVPPIKPLNNKHISVFDIALFFLIRNAKEGKYSNQISLY